MADPFEGQRHSRRLTLVRLASNTFRPKLAHSIVPPPPPHRERRQGSAECSELKAALLAPDRDDLYNIMSLERDCTFRDIRYMYKRLVFLYHPDRNPAPDATLKFITICRAYEVLSDRRKRNIYDAFGKASLQLFSQLNAETIETEAVRDGVLIFINRVIYPTWWFKWALSTISCCLCCMCCCCRARKITRDILDFVAYFERRNAAYRRDRSAGLRPVMRRPGVELQEKAKRFRSIYFKPLSPIMLPWTGERR
uniref:J domain-containing protein n=1 Tax=Plectus sambesii TaxID=2011161 RepID=A0A914W1P6_9BILA